MKDETIEPKWVCFKCAWDRKAEVPKGHSPTWHTGICGICKERTTVTEPRDFGKDRKKLRIPNTN